MTSLAEKIKDKLCVSKSMTGEVPKDCKCWVCKEINEIVKTGGGTEQ